MHADKVPTMTARSMRSEKFSGGEQSGSEPNVVAVPMKKRALAAAADANFRMIREARTLWDRNKLTNCIVTNGCLARTSRSTRLDQALFRNCSAADALRFAWAVVPSVSSMPTKSCTVMDITSLAFAEWGRCLACVSAKDAPNSVHVCWAWAKQRSGVAKPRGEDFGT